MGKIVKKNKSLLVLCFLLCVSTINISLIPIHLSEVPNTSSSLSSYTLHDAISISGNSAFATQGWPGSGSNESPYIIEGLEIVADDICISIYNTNVHFVIRNCLLSQTSAGKATGIRFSHVNNGAIENCSISHIDVGIILIDIDDCNIVNNSIADCGYSGILQTSSSYNCTLSENNVINCEDYGFRLGYLKYSVVENNYIRNCGQIGFTLANSVNTSVLGNMVEESRGFGLYFTMSINCTFINNTLVNGGFGVEANEEYHWVHNFSGNTINGKSVGYFFKLNDTEIDGTLYGQVFLISCYNVSLSSGIFFNASVGVSLFSCRNCTIDSVESSGNLYGANILQSENTTLTGNTFINCGVRIEGDEINHWNLTTSGNTVNGKQFGYILEQNDLIIDGNDFGQLILVNSDNLSITNGKFESVTTGIVGYNSFNCSIRDASSIDNYHDGIRLLYSNNCTLTNVTSEGSRNNGLYIKASNNTIVSVSEIRQNGDAIYVDSSNDFLIDSNQIYDNQGRAMYLRGTNYGVIRNNSIQDNGGPIELYVVNWLKIVNNTIFGSATDGLYLDFTSGVIIRDNRIYGNTGYGLNLESYTLYSEIYNNMIGFNGAGNALDKGIYNEWDDDIETGNIWSDYSDNGLYYYISGMGVDYYPLGFLSRPDDVQYIVGASVTAVSWDIRLPNPDLYTMLWDGVVITQGSLNSSLEHLSKPIEGLAVGIYNLTLVVVDESGYGLIDTVIITVVDESTTTITTITTTTSITTENTTTTTSTITPLDTSMVLISVVAAVVIIAVILLLVTKRKR